MESYKKSALRLASTLFVAIGLSAAGLEASTILFHLDCHTDHTARYNAATNASCLGYAGCWLNPTSPTFPHYYRDVGIYATTKPFACRLGATDHHAQVDKLNDDTMENAWSIYSDNGGQYVNFAVGNVGCDGVQHTTTMQGYNPAKCFP